MKILERAPRDQSIELRIGKEYIPVYYSQSLNIRVEAEPNFEEVMMTSLEEMTLEAENENLVNERGSFRLEEPQDPCSPQQPPKSRILHVYYENYNHLIPLDDQNFRRVVVDAFIYHKFCKSRSGSPEN